MKKFIAAAVLAGLATAAFADDAPAPSLTLGAYVDTGLTYVNNLKDKAYVGLWGEDAGYNGGRFKLTGKVAAGDYGFNFELRADGLINSNATSSSFGLNPVYFKTAYAYGNFFNKMVYTQIGLIDQRDTRPAGDAAPSFTKETPGAIVVVKPVDGLSVNAFIAPSASPLAGTATGTVAILPVINVANATDVVSSFGAAYTVPNTVKVMAQARMQNPKVAYGKAGAGFGGKDDYVVTDLYAGLGLLAVPNLTAWLEYQFGNLNTSKMEGKTTITETVTYGFKDLGVAPLSAGLIAYQYLYDTDLRTKDNTNTAPALADSLGLSLRLSPWVSYTLDGGITPKLMVSYLSGATVVDGKGYFTDFGYGSYAFTNMVAQKNSVSARNENNIAVLEIKPSVKFDLNKTMSMTFVGAYETSIGADKVSFFSTNVDANSLVYFQSNFTYSF